MSQWPEIDEDARRRFEAAWVADSPISIEKALDGVDPALRLGTLEELVCIELEMSWRGNPPGPTADDYLARFPELAAIEERVRDEAARVAERFGSGLRREGEIGRGGMGVVWRAADSVLGRDVALKELQVHARQHPELRRRFLAEARVTAQLAHPGIVPVYQLVEDGASPYYTMKLVEGRTLREAAEVASTPLEKRRLLDAFLSIARTVAFAHARGVVHRDLKPENVVLGELGETVVLDWGLARAGEAVQVEVGDPAMTQAGTVMGTPAYMSPELFDGHPADPKSDQYALGAVLYELLTGAGPFGGDSADTVISKVRAGPPPAPRTVDPTVAPELDAICRKAMARAPEDRYDSVQALAADLERYLADEPTMAWPEPWTRGMQRWARRHRTAVGIGLTATVVAGISLGIGVIAKERADAREARRVSMVSQGLRAAEAQARVDLNAGRYAEAQDRLAAALLVVIHEEELHGDAPALLGRALNLAMFVERAEVADRLAFLGLDARAAKTAERALFDLGVFGHADWWFELDSELPPERRDELQWAVWHQLNLLASLLAEDHCEDAKAIARHAWNFRHSDVAERAMACEPRDPCLDDGSGSYWVDLERARCTGSTPDQVREGIGHALRARARLAGDADPREAFGDMQAALDVAADVAEVQWLVAEGLHSDQSGVDTARAYARALELEQGIDGRSAAAVARLLDRVDQAEAFARTELDADLRDSLDARALDEQLSAIRSAGEPAHETVSGLRWQPVDEPPRRLAVLNGGFELGLARHWGRGMYESERPIWWNSSTARSTAEVVQDEFHSGMRSLHVVHETEHGPHLFGTTTQAVPCEKGANYELGLWSKGIQASGPHVIIVLDDTWGQHGAAAQPAGEWTHSKSVFDCRDDVVHLRVLSLRPAEVWLDDITIERVD